MKKTYKSFIMKIKKRIIKYLHKRGIRIISEKSYKELTSLATYMQAFTFLLSLKNLSLSMLFPVIQDSKSQNFQDIFVLSQMEIKSGGFFVEFGATNGIDLSNTYLLENQFGWRGILAEPAKYWHKELNQNRPNAVIEKLCVWKVSGEILTFNETIDANISTIDVFSNLDNHAENRKNGNFYPVKTISLLDLLEKNNAPKFIDYLSIDTEGSEFEILSAFDFEKYTFGIITCEHNFTPFREKIHELLASKGYVRRYEEFSLWDDWYIKV
jgi:FkbM family methyltransferase